MHWTIITGTVIVVLVGGGFIAKWWWDLAAKASPYADEVEKRDAAESQKSETNEVVISGFVRPPQDS